VRIGIVPTLTGSQGGVYQYSLTMLEALAKWRGGAGDDEFLVFAHRREPAGLENLARQGWSVKRLEPSFVKALVKDVLLRVAGENFLLGVLTRLQPLLGRPPGASGPDTVRHRPNMRRWFRRFGVGLMIYPTPTPLSFESGIPYIMSIHDLQHRLQPEFPEVSADGEWERREYLYRNGARNATILLADSETGREDILNCYGEFGVTPERVKVLPFLPAHDPARQHAESEKDRVIAKYNLSSRYLFYPAQFWPHKNHLRIMEALGRLRKEKSLRIPIVFCGSSSRSIARRTFRSVMESAQKLGIKEQTHFLDYVASEDMAGLYAGATALVMPTFFGPTNIPVLEAWSFACPVLTSDIRGIREQAGDAAVLVDPRSIDSIADGIRRLWEDGGLREQLIKRGRDRLARYTPEDFQKKLADILTEAKERLGAARS
jgi:glycosyltransferase involved in cell wall biosynthesis